MLGSRFFLKNQKRGLVGEQTFLWLILTLKEIPYEVREQRMNSNIFYGNVLF